MAAMETPREAQLPISIERNVDVGTTPEKTVEIVLNKSKFDPEVFGAENIVKEVLRESAVKASAVYDGTIVNEPDAFEEIVGRITAKIEDFQRLDAVCNTNPDDRGHMMHRSVWSACIKDKKAGQILFQKDEDKAKLSLDQIKSDKDYLNNLEARTLAKLYIQELAKQETATKTPRQANHVETLEIQADLVKPFRFFDRVKNLATSALDSAKGILANLKERFSSSNKEISPEAVAPISTTVEKELKENLKADQAQLRKIAEKLPDLVYGKTRVRNHQINSVIVDKPIVTAGGAEHAISLDTPNGKLAYITDKGNGTKYPKNEDGFAYLADSAGNVNLLLVDGMGGILGGCLAADVVARDAINHIRVEKEGMLDALVVASFSLEYRYQALVKNDGSNARLGGMGAVVVGAEIKSDGKCSFLNIGDARAIVIRDGKVLFSTKDQSLAQTSIDSGVVNEEAVLNDPIKYQLNVTLDAVSLDNGANRIFDANIYKEDKAVQLQKDDIVILGSDGLWDNFTNAEVSQLIGDLKDPTEIRNLLRQATYDQDTRAEHMRNDPRFSQRPGKRDNVAIAVYVHN